ncbi:hypothetical protein B9X71_07775 [Acinetobacter baumannii]|uniref:hypothetical protein n=1 Tax=Acinetobacter baumannii TaxID=470 RepID=UPI000A3566E3|nr:hypothetical protein [Acinetobacter baumannii]MCT9166204.1 hypothetical protein [Acinetobacter baumannii]MCT9173601.1 hypothetical protein [Acinetobacter baumannii]MCT9179962.1 hypothetical protein [Acinetobacter baumannii]OTK48154.1 hypothetical protein B9X71_07775 [Acinetobacter baumannii]
MNCHPFFGKKVVFKYPYLNETCFLFYSAFELIPMLRLATDEEIILGRRKNFNNNEEGQKLICEKI